MVGVSETLKDMAMSRMPPQADVQVAMINAAAKLAAAKIEAIGEDYNARNDFFSTEFERISKVIQEQGW